MIKFISVSYNIRILFVCPLIDSAPGPDTDSRPISVWTKRGILGKKNFRKVTSGRITEKSYAKNAFQWENLFSIAHRYKAIKILYSLLNGPTL
jgi:hypothetical protein